MSAISLKSFGRKIVDKRGKLGVRKAAEVIGVSPATLSRVERGNLPDLETFTKICKWLNINPGDVLGFEQNNSASKPLHVHFRKKTTTTEETAKALADMIIAADRALNFMKQEN